MLFILFYGCLFLIDWLKATVFAVQYHDFFAWFKTFFLVGGGITIMFLSLPKPLFKTFLAVYLSMWFIYFVLKKMLAYTHLFSSEKQALLADQYVHFTQILTPLPFIIFWLLNRVFRQPPPEKE